MKDDRKPWFTAVDTFASGLIPNTWQAWSCIGLLAVVGLGGAAVVQALVRDQRTALWVNLGLWIVEGLLFVVVAYGRAKNRKADRRPPDESA